MILESHASNDDPETSDIDVEVHTDFEKAFQAGYSFQYNMPDQGVQTVEFSVHPIGFSSGWGDGGYASYWGYDSANNIACIVTDFMLFDEDESITRRLA